MPDASKPAPLPQNPSPMGDYTRAHERIEERDYPGSRFTIDASLPEPVSLFIPDPLSEADHCDLLIHFHGALFVAEHAAQVNDCTAATVNLGAGSGVYERPFAAFESFETLLSTIDTRLGKQIDRLYLSGFSAGYGAIRAILRHHPERPDGVLLLDGLHTDYIPDGTPLASGGEIGAEGLAPFLDLARRAADRHQSFLFAHSELFPGTYASTTECADHLLRSLGLERTPVLEWGPLGMQQLSRAVRGNLAILGFAGNTAPDHMDHLHALYHFLGLLRAG